MEVQSPQHSLYGGSEAGMAGFEDVSIVEDRTWLAIMSGNIDDEKVALIC